MKYEIFSYEKRLCPLCGADMGELQFRHSVRYYVEKPLLMDISVCICKLCAFIYTNPCLTDESIDSLYEHVNPYVFITFSIENKISLIRKHVSGGVYIEIGSNQKNEFHEYLESIFDIVDLYDIKKSFSGVQETDSLRLLERADIVTSYFTLEHVKNVNEFLKNSAALLKNNGYLIIEVPNIEEYAHNSAAFISPEHVNHFSPRTLELCCNKAGLEMVDYSERLCSRKFGFAAVFRKSPQSAPPPTKAYYLCGREQIAIGALYFDRLNAIFSHAIEYVHENRMENMVFWGANHSMARLIAEYEERFGDHEFILVDSDPDKHVLLEKHAVYTPENAREHIAKGKIFVIAVVFHFESVKKSILAISGKKETEISFIKLLEPETQNRG